MVSAAMTEVEAGSKDKHVALVSNCLLYTSQNLLVIFLPLHLLLSRMLPEKLDAVEGLV